MLWVTGWLCGELRLGEVGVKFAAAGGLMYGDPRPREAALNLGAALGDAFLWFEDQKDNLGLTFEKHISKIIQTIQKNPLKIQIRYNQTRVAFLKKFPYGVHFNIIENEIIIVAVFSYFSKPKEVE